LTKFLQDPNYLYIKYFNTSKGMLSVVEFSRAIGGMSPIK